MNNEIIIAIAAAVVTVGAVIAAAKFPKIRHAFVVPEGYAGLLYRHGLFVRRINAGKHVVWGWVGRLTRKTCARHRCSWRARKCSRLTMLA